MGAFHLVLWQQLCKSSNLPCAQCDNSQSTKLFGNSNEPTQRLLKQHEDRKIWPTPFCAGCNHHWTRLQKKSWVGTISLGPFLNSWPSETMADNNIIVIVLSNWEECFPKKWKVGLEFHHRICFGQWDFTFELCHHRAEIMTWLQPCHRHSKTEVVAADLNKTCTLGPA